MNENKHNTLSLFHQKQASFLKELHDNFDVIINKARIHKVAFSEFKTQLFEAYLKEQKILPNIDNALAAIQKQVELDKNVTFEEVLLKSPQYQQMGSVFITLLASYTAKQEFIDFLNSHPLNNNEGESETLVNAEGASIISWDENFSQRDFLKIIYALKETGYLKGDITKLVPHMAKALNFKLNKEWRTNFSKGMHKSNHDFKQGQIFDTLKDAFESYFTRQIDNQIKRTGK